MAKTQDPKTSTAAGENRAESRGPGLLDRVLAGWGLEAPQELTLQALDTLHNGFLVHVPFENATKLVKATRSGNPAGGVRGPVEFWEEHLRWGSGGTCFAATYSYHFLLRYLGFDCRFVFCHLPGLEPDAHSALLVSVEDKNVLVDVGYALPAPVPLPEDGLVKRATSYYDVEVRKGPQDEYLIFSEDDRGQRFRYRMNAVDVPEAEYRRAWRKTFRAEAPYMSRLALGRFREGTRYLYKDPTCIFEITRGGERAIPLSEPVTASLSEVFRLPEPLLEAAFNSLKRLSA